MYDITQRKLTEDITRELAEKDSLTGLANRQAAELAIKELVTHNPHTNVGFVVMLIDLDRFKFINDTYGHDAGDAALIAVAERLRSAIRHVDQAFRLGGDEFAVVLAPFFNQAHVDGVIDRIRLAMELSYRLPNGMAVTSMLCLCLTTF